MKKFILLTLSLFIFLIVNSQPDVIFPRAFAFAIDDLGWNIGNDYGDVDGQGPYRIGLDRKMDLDDYKPIVEVGKAVGVRIQCLFVLAEMDRLNILRKHPSTTWEGANWDNTKNISNEQIRIMNYVKDNAAYLEFGLHGVGHEFWVNGKKVRAEWYDLEHDKPWPEDTLKTHIKCFKEIMAQYGLSPENHQRFPESYVPCAYGYYWNPNGDYSTGKVLAENGVKYGNTDFSYIRELNPPSGPNDGGFDHGLLIISRLNYGNQWFELSKLPTVPLEKQESDIIESHWTNWLAQDNFLQDSTTAKFIRYYQMVQKTKERYIAKNTEQFYSQWLYKKYAKVNQLKPGVVEIDNTAMPDDAYKYDILGVMVLKVPLKEGEHVSEATLNGKPIPAYFEQYGWGYLYLPILKQQKYTLEYKTGKKMMPLVVYNDGTYNVYDVSKDKKTIKIDLEMYGTQDVKIYCNQPQSIESDNPYLLVVNSSYDSENNMLILKIKGTDIQGERGTILLNY